MKTFCFQTLRSCFLPNGLPNGCISEVFMNISLLMKIDLLTHLEVINGWDHRRKHLQLNTGKSGKSISDTILWDCLSQQAQASDLFGVRIKTTNSSSIHLSCLYWRLNLRSGTERKVFQSHVSNCSRSGILSRLVLSSSQKHKLDPTVLGVWEQHYSSTLAWHGEAPLPKTAHRTGGRGSS